MADKDLERRIDQLEAIEAIRRLKARYCVYVDQPNEEAWVSLFTEDAVWESDRFTLVLKRRAPHAHRVAMETGPLAVWLWHSLRSAGVPVVCLHA